MKTMIIRVAVVLSLYLLVAVGHAVAATPAAVTERTIVAGGDAARALNEAWQASADAHVEVSNIRGQVRIRGWDKPEVALRGSLGGGSRLQVSGSSNHLVLQVKSNQSGWFGNSGPRQDTTLTLQVPRNSKLELHVISADADVADVAGKSLQVESVSGKLSLSSAAGEADVTSVSGDVDYTATGDATTRVHVQTVSGDIKTIDSRGRIKLETVSGNIQAQTVQVSDLQTGSVSGDAIVTTTLAGNARVHMESMSGDIRLNLPADLSAHIEASTFSGDIHSDYGKPRSPGHGPGSSLDTQVGSGDAQFDLQTFSGDIELHKGG